MYTPKSLDPIGRLIAQLHAIRDDIEYLKKVGKTPTIDDYPEAKKGLLTLVVPRKGVFTKHIDRVERAGIYIVSTDDVVSMYFPLTRGTLSFTRPTAEWQAPASERASHDRISYGH